MRILGNCADLKPRVCEDLLIWKYPCKCVCKTQELSVDGKLFVYRATLLK